MAESMKAQIATVLIGHIQVQGLFVEANGKFYVGVPQIVEQFTIDTKQPARYFKSLVGNDSTIDLTRLTISGTRITVNAISLEDFEILVAKLDRAGNKAAQDFRDELVGLSLHQMFADAFGHKFEADDRQDWLKKRQAGKQARRTFTDAIKSYIEANPTLSPNAVKFMYSNASDAINRAVFARPAKQLCLDLKVCDRDLLRDSFTDRELMHLQQVEDLAMRLLDSPDLGLDPIDSVKEARARLIIPVSNRVAV